MYYDMYCTYCDKIYSKNELVCTHYGKVEIKENKTDNSKEQPKMTREEANERLSLLRPNEDINYLITQLEALGLLKFEEEKKVKHCISFNTNQFGGKDEVVKIEQWSEGLVLWVGGEIKWKSWEKSFKIGDMVEVVNSYSDWMVGRIIK